MPVKTIAASVLLALSSTCVLAAGASTPTGGATCVRSLNLLSCSDLEGNGYSVATQGDTTYLRGYESASARRWAQTNSRYRQLTFFTGLASDGEIWVGTIRKVGWTTITRVSSSNGTRSSISCGRVTGCHEQKR
ncbi:glutamine synthetase [Pseudomonas sp. LJDD11]|uniref:glutamine synthetase n=1 Tax=unclassified Pseudomonas TaxID=196821 RepID=UPI002096D06C|nr:MULTISPECIES: glutamine synthetase [unclassified Pseudomonas]MCO8165578.1 glutamine synthetase [Pseudomonas sp. 21LCFQ010]MCQ9423719.1 glutamine synthetase [Pseudomonas sp. LJDD11]